jgi:hypothetical protein
MRYYQHTLSECAKEEVTVLLFFSLILHSLQRKIDLRGTKATCAIN